MRRELLAVSDYKKRQPQDIVVRKAQPGDAEQICHVHVISVQRLCVRDYTPEQIEAWVGRLTPEDYRNAITQANESLFVAEADGERIIGFSSLCGDKVYAVYVHPEYARQGIGRLLLKAVEKEAVAQGVETIKLSASTTAVPFYQPQGYQVIEHSCHTLRSGVQIPCVRMEKSLSKPGEQ